MDVHVLYRPRIHTVLYVHATIASRRTSAAGAGRDRTSAFSLLSSGRRTAPALPPSLSQSPLLHYQKKKKSPVLLPLRVFLPTSCSLPLPLCSLAVAAPSLLSPTAAPSLRSRPGRGGAGARDVRAGHRCSAPARRLGARPLSFGSGVRAGPPLAPGPSRDAAAICPVGARSTRFRWRDRGLRGFGLAMSKSGRGDRCGNCRKEPCLQI